METSIPKCYRGHDLNDTNTYSQGTHYYKRNSLGCLYPAIPYKTSVYPTPNEKIQSLLALPIWEQGTRQILNR